tara:strand:- start:451 stop:849 length:399 start_codon:yes stop_codon:yes gene_type:complete
VADEVGAKRPIDMTKEELFALGRTSTGPQIARIYKEIREDVEAKLAASADKIRENLTHKIGKVGKKTPAMEVFLQGAFGRNREHHKKAGTCVGCLQSASEFEDEMSEREYKITPLCQKCQDSPDWATEAPND